MGSAASAVSNHNNEDSNPGIGSVQNNEYPIEIDTGPNVISSVRSPTRDILPRHVQGSDRIAHSLRSANSESSLNMDSDLNYSALSLGVDSEDLLYNLYFFGATGRGSNIRNVMNTAMEETYAAHSVANTPYKLHPASEDVLASLDVKVLEDSRRLDFMECAVCKEDLAVGDRVVFLPVCQHCFHHDCAVHWLSLQAFCPVCRAAIVRTAAEEKADDSSPIIPTLSTIEEVLPPFSDEPNESFHVLEEHRLERLSGTATPSISRKNTDYTTRVTSSSADSEAKAAGDPMATALRQE